jgi:hypothetical protein
VIDFPFSSGPGESEAKAGYLAVVTEKEFCQAKKVCMIPVTAESLSAIPVPLFRNKTDTMWTLEPDSGGSKPVPGPGLPQMMHDVE